MRFAATLVVPMTGLALSLCPVAHADPEWTTEDWNYTKHLSEYGVSYQGRITTNEMMAKAHFVCDSLEENPTQAGLVSARDALVKQGHPHPRRSDEGFILRRHGLLSSFRRPDADPLTSLTQ
jgi:hypothetical protein